jgi:hypothetical protein
MDEQPRRHRYLVALVWFPLALVIGVPVVILLGLSFYVRAAATALAALFRFVTGRKAPPEAPTQAPHLFELGVPSEKQQPG